MPRNKRSPIDYQPQFGAGIFRPKEDVEQELAELERDASADAAEADSPVPDDAARLAGWMEEDQDTPPRSRRLSTDRSNEATNERTNVRTNERSRVRHSFDVWQDQLLGLTQIQVERFNQTGRKPKLGELVQEALDAYITRQRGTNVRTNERLRRRE